MIRPLVAALLAAAVALPAAPAEAGYTPMPYDPLPTSYEQLPLGPATTLAWWQANKLHAGGTTIRTRLHALAARAGTTVIGSGWSYPGRRSTAVVVRGGTTLVRLPIAGHIRGPEISADGHYIAWLDEQARTRIAEDLDRVRYRLVLYDATTFRVVADHRETREVEREDGINGLSLLSVANTGQALFTRSSAGPYVLAPGRRPVKVKGHLTQLRDWDGWPLGITTFRRRGGSDRGLFGTVSRRGRFHHVGTTSTGYGKWSPTGDAFAYDVEGVFQTTYWVDRPAAGTTVQLGLPTDRDQLSVLGWDGPASVLLWDAAFEAPQFLRCDAATGACQRVDGGPVAGRRVVVPRN